MQPKTPLNSCVHTSQAVFMICPSSLSHCPCAEVCQVHHPCRPGFSHDSKFFSLGLTDRFRFPVGTCVLYRLTLMTDPTQLALCYPSDLQDSIVVLATGQEAKPREGCNSIPEKGTGTVFINCAFAMGKWRKWQKNLFVSQFHSALIQSVVFLDVSPKKGRNIGVTWTSLKMEWLIYTFSEMFSLQLSHLWNL